MPAVRRSSTQFSTPTPIAHGVNPLSDAFVQQKRSERAASQRVSRESSIISGRAASDAANPVDRLGGLRLENLSDKATSLPVRETSRLRERIILTPTPGAVIDARAGVTNRGRQVGMNGEGSEERVNTTARGMTNYLSAPQVSGFRKEKSLRVVRPVEVDDASIVKCGNQVIAEASFDLILPGGRTFHVNKGDIIKDAGAICLIKEQGCPVSVYDTRKAVS